MELNEGSAIIQVFGDKHYISIIFGELLDLQYTVNFYSVIDGDHHWWHLFLTIAWTRENFILIKLIACTRKEKVIKKKLLLQEQMFTAIFLVWQYRIACEHLILL